MHAVTSCETNIGISITSLVPSQNDEYHRCLITHGVLVGHGPVITSLRKSNFREPIHDWFEDNEIEFFRYSITCLIDHRDGMPMTVTFHNLKRNWLIDCEIDCDAIWQSVCGCHSTFGRKINQITNVCSLDHIYGMEFTHFCRHSKWHSSTMKPRVCGTQKIEGNRKTRDALDWNVRKHVFVRPVRLSIHYTICT